MDTAGLPLGFERGGEAGPRDVIASAATAGEELASAKLGQE